MSPPKCRIRGQSRIAWTIIAAVIIVIVILGALIFAYYYRNLSTSTTATSSSVGTSISTSSTTILTSSPIQHIVIIMQENRAFDNLFWSYPGVMGGESGNSSYCIPYSLANPTSSCVKPKLSTVPAISGDLPHTFASSYISYNNGSMNGFLQASNDNINSTVYYDNATIPTYWSYAEHYTLDDNAHSSVMSYSQPNHWYMVAGASPNASLYMSEGQEHSQCVAHGAVSWSTCTYFQEGNKTQTIVDLLASSGISWKYYDAPLVGSYTQNIVGGPSVPGFSGAYQYWNTLAAKQSSYTLYASHFVWRGEFFDDVGNHTLPAVSWVIPAGGISDHPPASLTLGQIWVADVIDAIMKSSYWNDTAIILTWDDYGGFFDVLAPPVLQIPVVLPNGSVVDTPYGLGFRTPMIIISPYAKHGYVDHTLYSFESTLKFIEWNYKITAQFASPLQQASVARANNLLNSFDFDQSPLPPDVIPLSQSQLSEISICLRENCAVNINPGGTTATTLVGQGLSDNYSVFLNGDPD